MAKLGVSNVVVRGIATCVPGGAVDNANYVDGFSDEEVLRVVKSTGVKARHIAGGGVCTSDLCFSAAERLIEKTGWSRDSIELLVFVTQTPDYFMPSTACVLQSRLKLSDRCAAFDVGLGCSGYPYGLCLVSRLLQVGGVSRALLLVGETPSKVCDPVDRSTSLIFGDAGSATALEAVPSGPPSSYLLFTDGEGRDDFIVRAGGFRDRFSDEKRDHFIRMNGAGIFSFTLTRVPELFRQSLEFANLEPSDVDFFILHQANGFILEHLRKKMGLPREKVPIVIDRFGNTGGVSLALAVTQGGLSRLPDRPLQLLMMGYGVGLSWSAAVLQLLPEAILDHSVL